MAADGYLNFDTKINTSGFSRGLKTVDGLADKLKGTFSKVGAAVTAAFSIAAVSAFAKECKSLYDVQLEAETKLSTILHEHLDATDEQIQATKDYASALQEVGVIGDEIQLSGLQELATYIDNADSLKTMNRVLNDMLAQQYGLNATAESAVTISTMLGKVLEGQTSALSRYGYSFTEAQEKLLKFGTEEQRVATLAAVVEDSVGGVNAALARTPAGRMKQLDNTLGDIKEQFGAAVYQLEILFLPALKKVADLLADIASLAEMAAAAIANVFGERTSELSAVSSGVQDVSDAYQDLLDNAPDTSGLDELSEELDEIGDKARQVEREVDLDGARAAMAAVSDTSAAIAAGAENSAESYDEMADAAKKAEKANKGSLASFDKINKLGGDDESVTASEKTADDAERSRRVAAQAEEIEEVFRKINNLRKIYDTSEEEALKQKEEYLNRLRSSGALLEENDKRYSAEFENEQANIIAEQREEYYRQLQEQYDEEYAAQKKAAEQAKKLAEENKSAESSAPSVRKISNPLTQAETASNKLEGAIGRLKTLLSELFAPLESAWDKYGQGAVDSMERAFTNVWELVKSIGKSFVEVWTNGTGEEMVGHILGIFTQINNYSANLTESFRRAWSKDNIGTDIIQHAADIFNTILGHVENIAAAWAEWAGEVNFSPLLEAFDHLEQAVKPIVDDLGSWFEDINNDLLIPLSTWTTETLIPTALDSIAKALEGLHAAWETAYPVVKEKLWDKFLKPLAKWAGEKSVQLIKEFGDAIKEWGENLTEKDVELLIDLAEAVGALTVAVKGAGLLAAFSTALGKLAGAFAPAAASIGAGIGAVITDVALPVIIGAIAGWGIGTLIRDAIGGDNVDDFLFEIFDTVVAWWDDFSTFWAGVWSDIKDEFTSVIENLRDYFVKTKDGFDNAIEEVKETFREFGSFFTEDIPGWWDTLQSDTLFPIYDKISEVWEKCKKFFTEDIPGWWDTLQSDTLFPIYDKALAVWNSVKDFFTQQIPEFFTVTVPQFFSDSWEKITSIFSLSNVQKHFTNIVGKIKNVFGKIGGFFKDIFKKAWEHVTAAFDLENAKKLFSNVASKMAEGFSGIISLIKSPINGVIDVFNFLMDAISSGFNAVTGVIEDLVNSVADTVNALSFDIPDWAGGGTLGFDMPHVTIPEISIPHLPKLASGTVVPANYGEFAAILGDNKREPEVVSPLGTIKQALVQALRENGSDGGDIYIYLDGEELSYSMERRAGKRSKRTGKGG